MPAEIWKDIKGYEGLYQISNFGNVKRIQSNKYIKPHNEKGYIRVALCKNNKVKHLYLHRLIATALYLIQKISQKLIILTEIR